MKIRISLSDEAAKKILKVKENFPELSATQITNKLISDIPYEELIKCLQENQKV